MIRKFPQRMRRLSAQLAQQRLAMHLDEQGRTPSQVIRERRLQLAAEREGRVYEIPKQTQDLVASTRQPQSLSELIRAARLKKASGRDVDATKKRTSMRFLNRVSKLERTMKPKHQHRIAIRFEGATPLSAHDPEVDEHTKFITVQFIKAKDGRPANPEDLIED